MQSSADISNIRFDKSPFGYKVDDVDRFVDEAAQLVEQLEEENRDLENKLEVLALKLEEYKSEEESLRSAVLGAQKLGDSIIRDSKNKAEVLLRDATTRAERMVESTQSKMEKERMALTRIQKEVADFKNRLLGMYRQHLELISAMPELGSESKAPVKEAAPAPAPEPVAEGPVQPAEYASETFADSSTVLQDKQTEAQEPEASPLKQGSRYGELLFGDDFGRP